LDHTGLGRDYNAGGDARESWKVTRSFSFVNLRVLCGYWFV
jgi:hypothetical protein